MSDENGGSISTPTKDNTLLETLPAFEKFMREEGFAINTIKSFSSDMRLMASYLKDKPLGEISTKDLNNFLNWLLHERGVPCSPKSYARRVTTMKVFFSWLRKNDMIYIDPAEPVVQSSASSPLPNIPTQEDIDKAKAVADAWSQGKTIEGLPRKKDTRPQALLHLLLQTGAKKREIKDLSLDQILREDPQNPQVFIRYKTPRYLYKERKLAIDPELLAILDRYIQEYDLNDELFTCTPRNLEYILGDIANEAALERGLLSFENLRWASALRDLREGMDDDLIREKLGLSKITWRETRSKLEKLREKQSEESPAANPA